MKSVSMAAFPAWRDGKAPKTRGEAVNEEVYRLSPNSLSTLANPAGDPGIE